MTRLAAALLALLTLTPCARGRAQELTPPGVIDLPPVDLPPDVPPPEGGAVRVRVTIGADGAGVVAECDAAEALCALVADAIAAARFRPATRDGAPIPSVVSVELAVVAHAPTPAEGPAPDPAPAAEVAPRPGADAPDEAEPVPALPAAPPAEGEDDLPVFEASAVVEVPVGTPTRMALAELRELPGAFGEPYRAIDALPGVTPVISGAPYVYVRGAPPSGTLYVYDGIPVPTLFHLALGPSVIHPAMIGAVNLFSGVPPARHGRLLGGAVVGEGPGPVEEGVHGEVELRAVDVTAMTRSPVGDGGSVAVAGRYGYPGLLLSVFNPDVQLAYWDYQSRLALPLSARDRLELVWFGSFDDLGTRDSDGDRSSFRVTFHRVEARLTRRLSRAELGAALRFGRDESSLDEELVATSTRFGPLLWATYRRGIARLRVGADMSGIAGDIRASSGLDDDGDLTDPSDDPIFTAAGARSISGLHSELVLAPSELLTLELGLRGDLWLTGDDAEIGVDPRARAVLHLPRDVDLHVAVGLLHQPAVFFLPLPGLADVAIDRGLQRAIQVEAGARAELPAGFEAELQGFAHHYRGLLFLDLFLDLSDGGACEMAGGEDCDVTADTRTTGTSYGVELFVRRDPEEVISGWLSYTLSRATVDALSELPYAPSYDIRHVLNLVLGVRTRSGFRAGARLHARSGRPSGVVYLEPSDLSLGRYQQRLPWFTRLDVELSYGWRARWDGEMRITAEWFNVTLASEPVDIDCGDGSFAIGRPEGPCAVDRAGAIWFPNLGFRASF